MISIFKQMAHEGPRHRVQSWTFHDEATYCAHALEDLRRKIFEAYGIDRRIDPDGTEVWTPKECP